MWWESRLVATLRQIKALPEPQRSAAMGNYRDAERDLKNWPWLWERIVDDLDNAVAYHSYVAQRVGGEA